MRGCVDGREKIEAALSPEGTAEFGVVICYEGIYIRDHWEQLTDCPWWYAQSPGIAHQAAWMEQVHPAIQQDWLYLETSPSRGYRESHRVVVEADDIYIENKESGEKRWLTEPQVGGWENMEAIAGGKTSAEWRTQAFPMTPEQIDLALPLYPQFNAPKFRADGHTDLAGWQLRQFSGHYPIRHITIPLTDCYYLWGFEGMMEMIAGNPGLVSYACERYLTNAIRNAKMAKELGARGIWIEDCFTDMISPAAFEKLNLATTRPLVEAIRSLGMSSIYYFCGDPKGKLELILSAGADALALEESKKGFTIDIVDVVDAVAGRCAVFGNLDAIHLLPAASPEVLRSEIRRQITAGRRNRSRFVMSIGSPVTPGTTAEQVRLYCAIAREEGLG
jgi:hypothetical protein